MKKHITLALFIAVLLGVLSIGCNKQPSEKTSVGDTIVFGSFMYEKYGFVRYRPIEWYVLKKDTANHRIMLVAMDILKIMQYHTEIEDATWAESTIRSWLNGYGANENKQSMDYTSSNFITIAFTNEERARIAKLKVVNENNPKFGTPGGANTQDQVFLLSIAEVQNLLGLTKDDICSKIHCTTYWWLRSPGGDPLQVGRPGVQPNRPAGTPANSTNYAAIVNDDGNLNLYGIYERSDTTGVRPALWLNY